MKLSFLLFTLHIHDIHLHFHIIQFADPNKSYEAYPCINPEWLLNFGLQLPKTYLFEGRSQLKLNSCPTCRYHWPHTFSKLFCPANIYNTCFFSIGRVYITDVKYKSVRCYAAMSSSQLNYQYNKVKGTIISPDALTAYITFQQISLDLCTTATKINQVRSGDVYVLLQLFTVIKLRQWNTDRKL